MSVTSSSISGEIADREFEDEKCNDAYDYCVLYLCLCRSVDAFVRVALAHRKE